MKMEMMSLVEEGGVFMASVTNMCALDLPQSQANKTPVHLANKYLLYYYNSEQLLFYVLFSLFSTFPTICSICQLRQKIFFVTILLFNTAHATVSHSYQRINVSVAHA